MVSQRSRLNLIMVVCLCMINIMRIKSDDYLLPMTLGGDGAISVNFMGITFTLGPQLDLMVVDADCRYEVKFDPFDPNETGGREEQRTGSLDCTRPQIP
ncbi:unnamed protein product [Trichobilharzia szidati]|nr:unnamed protein product [Trichobilharzia szidati]